MKAFDAASIDNCIMLHGPDASHEDAIISTVWWTRTQYPPTAQDWDCEQKRVLQPSTWQWFCSLVNRSSSSSST